MENNEKIPEPAPEEKVPGDFEKLSPYGKALLKQLGGNPRQLALTAATVNRWGMDRPESVIHAIPKELKELILALPDDLAGMPEPMLEKAIPGGVTRQDRRIRIRYWQAYEQAHKMAEPMELEAVALSTGLPSWQSYQDRLQQTPALLAWMMKPPVEYQLQLSEGTELGMNRIMEIMSLPLVTKTTLKSGKTIERVNTGVGLLILAAFKLLDQRLNGGYTTKNINMNMEAGKVPDGAVALDMAAIEQKLKELESTMGSNKTFEATDAEIVE